MILPPWFCCSSVGIMALQSKNDPTTLTSSTRRNSSSLSSTTGTRSAPRAMAALLTRISIRPKVASVCCTMPGHVGLLANIPDEGQTTTPLRLDLLDGAVYVVPVDGLFVRREGRRVAPGARHDHIGTLGCQASLRLPAQCRAGARRLSQWPLYRPELPRDSPLSGYA